MRQNVSRLVARVLASVVPLVLVSSSPAFAEGFISPLLGLSFGGDTIGCAGSVGCAQRGTSWALSAGTAHGIFGFEEDISYVKEFFGTPAGRSSAILTISSNFLVRSPTGRVRPYGVFGLAFVRPHATLDAEGFGADRTTVGYDVGGGVEMYVHPRLAVRTDLRSVRTLQEVSLGMFGTEQLNYWRGSAGVSLKF